MIIYQRSVNSDLENDHCLVLTETYNDQHDHELENL